MKFTKVDDKSNFKGKKVREDTNNRLSRKSVGKFHHIDGINMTVSMKISDLQKLRTSKCHTNEFRLIPVTIAPCAMCATASIT